LFNNINIPHVLSYMLVASNSVFCSETGWHEQPAISHTLGSKPAWRV